MKYYKDENNPVYAFEADGLRMRISSMGWPPYPKPKRMPCAILSLALKKKRARYGNSGTPCSRQQIT